MDPPARACRERGGRREHAHARTRTHKQYAFPQRIPHCRPQIWHVPRLTSGTLWHLRIERGARPVWLFFVNLIARVSCAGGACEGVSRCMKNTFRKLHSSVVQDSGQNTCARQFRRAFCCRAHAVPNSRIAVPNSRAVSCTVFPPAPCYYTSEWAGHLFLVLHQGCSASEKIERGARRKLSFARSARTGQDVLRSSAPVCRQAARASVNE